MSETLRIVTFTLSDTRTRVDDVGGRLLREKLEAVGFTMALHGIIREEPDALREAIHNTCDAGIADSIKAKQTVKPVIYQSTHTNPLINLKWIFLLLAGLLSVEWFLRRYFGAY